MMSSMIGYKIDTVSTPAACGISIVNTTTGRPLPYGEIAVKGPGAIRSYVGIPTSISHTPTGWLKTGDVGCLDRTGHLFIKGRSKEIIKRGGEQVWPNEIDDVILSANVPNVKTVVKFTVPNEFVG